MPIRPTNRWRGASFAAAIGAIVLVAGAGFASALDAPTREQIIESLRAKQLTRCPRFDPKAGCGVAPPASGIDVEIRFGRASASLGAGAVSQLEKLGAALRQPELKGAALVVAGHADARGSDEYNQHLSERRAEAVKHFLVARFKLPEASVTAVGHGKTQPKNTADPFAGENRRVAIVKADAGGQPATAPDRR